MNKLLGSFFCVGWRVFCAIQPRTTTMMMTKQKLETRPQQEQSKLHQLISRLNTATSVIKIFNNFLTSFSFLLFFFFLPCSFRNFIGSMVLHQKKHQNKAKLVVRQWKSCLQIVSCFSLTKHSSNYRWKKVLLVCTVWKSFLCPLKRGVKHLNTPKAHPKNQTTIFCLSHQITSTIKNHEGELPANDGFLIRWIRRGARGRSLFLWFLLCGLLARRARFFLYLVLSRALSLWS